MLTEKKARTGNGYSWLVILFFAQIASIALLLVLPGAFKIIALLLVLLVAICWIGFYMVAPNEGKIMQLFGSYAGTDHTPGLRWANPLYKKTPISLRVRNFESGKLKVNDASGNPIEIAAVVVWKVEDTAEAFFEVDNYVGWLGNVRCVVGFARSTLLTH